MTLNLKNARESMLKKWKAFIASQIEEESEDSLKNELIKARAEIESLKAEVQNCRIELNQKNDKIGRLKHKLKVSSEMIIELFTRDVSDECEDAGPSDRMGDNSSESHDDKTQINGNTDSELMAVNIEGDESVVGDMDTKPTAKQEPNIYKADNSLLTPLPSFTGFNSTADSPGLLTFACKLCPKKFKSRFSLKHHRKIHAGRHSYKNGGTASHSVPQHQKEPNHNTFACDVCQKTYTFKGNMNRHKRVSH